MTYLKYARDLKQNFHNIFRSELHFLSDLLSLFLLSAPFYDMIGFVLFVGHFQEFVPLRQWSNQKKWLRKRNRSVFGKWLEFWTKDLKKSALCQRNRRHRSWKYWWRLLFVLKRISYFENVLWQLNFEDQYSWGDFIHTRWELSDHAGMFCLTGEMLGLWVWTRKYNPIWLIDNKRGLVISINDYGVGFFSENSVTIHLTKRTEKCVKLDLMLNRGPRVPILPNQLSNSK